MQQVAYVYMSCSAGSDTKQDRPHQGLEQSCSSPEDSTIWRYLQSSDSFGYKFNSIN